MDNTANDDILARLRAKTLADADIKIPPNVFTAMDGELLHYDDGEALTARFSVHTRYQNPMHHMQGGMIVAAMTTRLGR